MIGGIDAGGFYPLGEAVAVGGLAAASAHVDVVLGWLAGGVEDLSLAIAAVSRVAGDRLRVLVSGGVRGQLAFLRLRPRLRRLWKIHHCFRAGSASRLQRRSREQTKYLGNGRRCVLASSLGARRLPLPTRSVAARPVARR
ncbi:Os11g0442380 [Oryza sativa Japonica Group]|uniref:Os11g0442380 protein n=1 Tax=Oryza sativa subsp. japonica TaxID=39947 RepID=A0A0P0Y1W6_ORYSJ|nr:hypothetical protein EE612_055271 [Oryza sativa]BAT13873.1 Os11g0442380 [Oryza sativa Japonica Group]